MLHSIPSGILHPGRRCVIGCGVVVASRPRSSRRWSRSCAGGLSLDGNLFISKNAHLIMPYHPALDRASEAKLGARRIGTTGKGVGPAYMDKAARVGIRMADLLDERLFRDKLEVEPRPEEPAAAGDLRRPDVQRRGDPHSLPALRGMAGPVHHGHCPPPEPWIDSGYSVLFEGAQGTMLDIDHGTYPYVTSSSTTAGGAAIGTGVPPTRIHGVLGVAKAYTTRVGGGPFPTEMEDAVAETIRDTGQRVRRHHGPAAALRLVRRRGHALRRPYQRLRHGGPHQARRARPVRDHQDLYGLRWRGDILTDFPEEETAVARSRAGVRGSVGLGAPPPRVFATRPSCRPRPGGISSASRS